MRMNELEAISPVLVKPGTRIVATSGAGVTTKYVHSVTLIHPGRVWIVFHPGMNAAPYEATDRFRLAPTSRPDGFLPHPMRGVA
jgi:hypothetical protein